MSQSKVTADSYGKVDVSNKNNECWMLRIPPTLAAAWEDVPEGTVLGELVFRKGGKVPGKPTIKPGLDIQAEPTVAKNLPQQYSLQAMTKKLPTLHPFIRQANGSVSIQGTITRTANLQVTQDANYRQLCKTRILKSTVHKSRFVKPVEANQVVHQSKKRTAAGGAAAGGSGFGDAVHQYGKRLLEAQSNPQQAKKARFSPDQPTKSIIFELFEQQQFWAAKDLKMASGGRSDNEIREVLREIADYHRSGDHKTMWELKKEFQNKSKTTA
eukprot:scaffold5653_cov147-Cylindrotheca_fusiformis.AAC.29